MRITELKIEYFRGIKSADIIFPPKARVLCFIGPGDSTKSTILKAVEWLLCSSPSLSVSDNDFYLRDVKNPICITASISEIPPQLMTDDKYGMFLRNPAVRLNLQSGEISNDEPADGGPCALAVRLTVGDDLDPVWEVACNHRTDSKRIPYGDRRRFCVGSIGSNYSRDLSWGRYSALQKITDDSTKDSVQDICTQLNRTVVNAVPLNDLDGVTREKLDSVAREYGVSLNKDELVNRIQLQNGGSLSAAIGVYEKEIPLTQRGTGSQRLLSMGLNIEVSDSEGILLVDEVENGLEPYRLCTLIDNLRKGHKTSGQVMMTTHSPITLQECDISELMIVHCTDHVEIVSPESPDKKIHNLIQGGLRKYPDSFLCRKIIVCEGATEVGFLRALDTYLMSKENGFRLAYKGVGTLNGGGNPQMFDYAKTLKTCGYDVCLFMDSDIPTDKLEKDFPDDDIDVFRWDDHNALENQIFSDVTQDGVTQLIELAISKGILNRTGRRGLYDIVDDKVQLVNSDAETMKRIGEIAKKESWYKSVGRAEAFGDIVFSVFDDTNQDASQIPQFMRVIKDLISWAVSD